ncbi:MAG: PIN domain-containing protein [Caldilineales bacterium]|nr:PIN domain-containing protein [Caldilineales bacterium]
MTESTDRQFIDTNVLVYAHDLSAGDKRLRAKSLFHALWESELGCVSVQVMQEFYVIATNRLKPSLDPEQAKRIVTLLGTWHLHRPGPQDVADAIDLHRRYQISFWDAMILQSAAQLGCETLWSEDLNAGQTYGSVEVRNPFDERS